MLFADILLSRNIPRHPPPLGAGRVHRIEDDEGELPDQSARFRAIVEAVKRGAFSVYTISSLLEFKIAKPMLVADCCDLVRQGLLVEDRSKTAPRYFCRKHDLPTHPLLKGK